MATQHSIGDALRDAVPFLGITVLWTVITGVVYGAFVLVWPDVPGAEPYMHLGVYVLPLIGFFGHTLHQALSVRATPAETARREPAD